MTTIPAPHPRTESGKQSLGRVLRDNGLSLVLLATFVLLLWIQSVAGFLAYNQEQQEHGSATITYLKYLTSPHFLEATAENWESEFLQMGAFVWLTVFLFQKGSPESKDPDEENEEVDREPDTKAPGAPWPVRKGGAWLKLYSHSLTLAFLLLFLMSFLVHAVSGAREYSERQIEHGEAGVSVMQFMGTSEFWFQSMQNWQSEFLAILAMVFLAVYLRQKGSPESKPVDAPHDENE
jgi:hypothetical protein